MNAVNTPRVTLLLASFNGEIYLPLLCSSLLRQQGVQSPLQLILSDDCSTDSSVDVVERALTSAEDLALLCEQNESDWVGAAGNFAHLCDIASRADSSTFFFVDQDDEWKANKVERSLLEITALSQGFDESLPAMVFSDLEVVDETGKLIATSFADYQGLPPPGEQPLHRLLHQNVVTGCTVCFNRPLLELAHPIPRSALMHDHWFGLCAKVFGKWSYIDEPLVKYRQHGENTVGAKSAVVLRSWLRADIYKMLFNYPFHLAQAVEQAEALKNRMLEHSELISEDDLSTVDAFAGLRRVGLLSRWKIGMRFFDGKRSLGERAFLLFVLAIIPWVKVQR